nr:hypothetical protein BSM_00370 [uncultured archaeon]
MCIELERKRFFRFLYYCIISIGCWVIVGQPVKRHGIEIVNNNTDEWHFFPPNPIASTKYASAEEVHREWVNCMININNILECKLSK